MPWLIKNDVLMIHVPRCGGTSITKHHKLPQKSREGKDLYHKFSMLHYFYRYRLLETANFPFVSIENLVVLIQVTLGCLLYFFVPGIGAPYYMWSMASLTFVLSTFVFTAPAIRFTATRRAVLFTMYYILYRFGRDTNMLTGNTINGLLLHFKAKQLIDDGYVTKEQVRRCGFSIVRNPYSRMVSVYMYNRLPGESFKSFVKSFHKQLKETYELHGFISDWHVYCHVLPMHVYTHDGDEQLVPWIIKQEQLGKFMKSEWAGTGLPKNIADALTGIPHKNGRKRKDPWYNYYDQETMDLVLEMYGRDFELFGYDKHVPNRSDLIVNEPVPEAVTARSSDGGLSPSARAHARIVQIIDPNDASSLKDLEIAEHLEEGTARSIRSDSDLTPSQLEPGLRLSNLAPQRRSLKITPRALVEGAKELTSGKIRSSQSKSSNSGRKALLKSSVDSSSSSSSDGSLSDPEEVNQSQPGQQTAELAAT